MILTSTVVTYSVVVESVNDDIPEPRSEGLQLSFSVEEDTVEFLPNSSVIITIEDNDGEAGTYIQSC